MSKIRKKIAKGLGAFLLVGTFAFLPITSKAQDKYRLIIDNFSQPNVVTQDLNWYGSGDIDNNDTINWQDYYSMQFGVQNDRADIDGDGEVTIQDKQTLEKYLNQEISHLPGHWNKLNKNEKLDWAKKMIEIDKTDELPYIDDNWECGNFSDQTCINFHGFNVNPEIYVTYDFNNNGRFNLPVYSVSTNTENTDNGTYHAINSILTGNNSFDFNDWYFFEPQTDDEVKIGDSQMPKDKQIVIQYIYPKTETLNAFRTSFIFGI